MAVTLFTVDGFEHGQLVGNTGWSNLNNTSISTSTVRTGLRSLRINPTAATGSARWLNNEPASTFIALCFYIRFATLPDNDWTVFDGTGPTGTFSIRYKFSDNKFQANCAANSTSFGPTLSTGQWYRVVLEFDASTSTGQVRCVINNDTANEVTVTGSITSANFTACNFGQAATTRTLDAFFDDLALSVTDGNYEQMRDDWSDQAIESLIPSSDGTHNITTSGDFDSFTGTAFSNSTTNGNTFIGHRPMQFANTADQVIRQELGTTSNYMEFGMENHTLSGTPIGGKSLATHVEAAASGASLGEARLLLSDDTEVLTGASISVINSTQDPGTTVTIRRGTLIAPSGGWDNTKIDGLKARIGFADGAPDVNFIDFMVEFLYAGKTITGTALSATPTLPAGEVSAAAGGQTVTGVALTATPSLPAATLDHQLTGVALSITPSLPVATLDHKLTGVALSATPTLPAGALTHTLTGTALSATPTLPAGTLTHTITGVALAATPTLPAGSVTTPGLTVTGVALSATPSLPAGNLIHTVTGVALTAAPSLPVGTLNHGLTGTALTVIPSLPAGALRHQLTGTVLTVLPVLPAGSIAVPQFVTGVVLLATPELPQGQVQIPVFVDTRPPDSKPNTTVVIRPSLRAGLPFRGTNRRP